MTQSLEPYSIVRPIGTGTWPAILDTLRRHVIYDPFSNWNVQLWDDSGADTGLTVQNSTIGTPQFNFRYEDSTGYMYIAIDPQGSISDPQDPIGTGSSEVSPESNRAGDPNPSFVPNALIFDWPEALGMMFMNTSERYFDAWAFTGRVYEPHFANDPSRGTDGLGWYGGKPDINQGGIGEDSDLNISSEARTPDGWGPMKTRSYDNNTTAGSFQQVDHPQGISLEADNGNGFRRPIGTAKYIQVATYRAGGLRGIATQESTGGGTGFVFTSHSSDNNPVSTLIPWDTSTDPTNIDDQNRYKGIKETDRTDTLFAFRPDTCSTSSGYPLRESEIGIPTDGGTVDYWKDAGGGQIFWEVSSTYNATPGGVLLDRSASDSVELLEHSAASDTTRLTYSGNLHSDLSLAIRFQHQGAGLSTSGDQQALVATGTPGSGSPSFFLGLEHNGSGVVVRATLDDGSSALYDISTSVITLSSSGLDDVLLEHDSSAGTATLRWNPDTAGTPAASASASSITFPTLPVTPEDHATIGASAGTNFLDAVVQGAIAYLNPDRDYPAREWIDGQRFII